MSVFVTDTHPLVYYSTGEHRKLSAKALAAFEAARQGAAFVWVPAAVLWEFSILLKLERIRLREPFAVWSERLAAQRGFGLAVLDLPVLHHLHDCPLKDPFDSAIAATAKALDLPLITRDERITSSGFVAICW